MGPNMTLTELLEFLSHCTGDEALELIGEFQSGTMSIEGVNKYTLEFNKEKS
jgi:hypothetical protein